MSDWQKVGTAYFARDDHDLIWCFISNEDGMLEWRGYEDLYWWEYVSTSSAFFDLKGRATGRIYRLSVSTGVVSTRS